MAGRREYEMKFALNASMNGNFSGTFSKAQQEFARLGKEIQNLKKVQGDVSSYQKQQAAVQNTTSKLDSLRRQEALLEEQIKMSKAAKEQDVAAIAGLEREQIQLADRIKNTETALERQNKKLTETGERLKTAGVDTKNLEEADKALTDTLEALKQEQDEASKGALTFGEKAAAGFDAAGQALAAAGIAAGMKELANAFVDCVGIAGDFEEAMSTVEALSQANEREMSALTAEAKELGATTKFTAKESADAMGYMAMAGWDATEMLEGMNGVLQLAAASGEDLAMVSDIVTDSLSAFGLTAADTAHFSDVLAAAATNSNTNVAIMGETFKMSASVAGALGYKVEDVATAMGLMANSGVKGSIAGTALRNTFNGLLEGVTLTGAAFGEYQYSAVRANGTMKSFGATIDELREYFEQMTEAERVSNAQAIAGQRGYNGLLAILNATDEDYQSLTNSINNCTGAAERMAKIKLDNLNGQLTLMNSAWDALKTTIGEQFIPELRTLAEAGTDALTWVDGFIKDHPALTKGVMVFTGAMGAAAVAVTGVNAALKLFNVLNIAAMFTGPVGVILGASAAIAGVAGAVMGLVTAVNEGIPSVKELTESARGLDETMQEASNTYHQTTDDILATAGVADVYIGKLEAMGDYASLSAQKQREYHNILSLLCQTVPELAEHIDLENNTIEGGTAALRTNTEAWKKNAMAQAMQDRLTAMYAAQSDVLVEAEKNRMKLTEAETKAEIAEKKLNEARAKAVTLYQESKKNGTELTQEYYDTQDAISELAAEYQDTVRVVGAYQEAVDGSAEAAAAAQAAIDEAAAAMGNIVWGGDNIEVPEELTGVLDPLLNDLDRLQTAYNNAYEAARESFSGQFGLFDEAEADMDSTVAAAQKALDSQLAYWKNYAGNIEQLKSISAEDLHLTQENYDKLMTYVRNGTPEAAGLAASMVKAVNSGNSKALTDLGNTIGEISESQDQAAQDMAVWTSGLTDQMGQLITDVETEVAKLDMSAEAAENARATIQAYIDQAETMKGPLQAAFKGLWQGVLDSMPASMPVPASVPSESFPEKGAKPRPKKRFASGTQSAPPGWAWVGEEGPELMRMRGGETVLPAEISREFAFLTALTADQAQNPIAAYAGGTDDAPGIAAELTELVNRAYEAYNAVTNNYTAVSQFSDVGTQDQDQQLQLVNNAYANYSNAVYNTGAHNVTRRGDYTYTAFAAPQQSAAPVSDRSFPARIEATEAVPAVGSANDSAVMPSKVEVHIHLEGGATPEIVQALDDCVHRGELQEAVAAALESIQTERARRAIH